MMHRRAVTLWTLSAGVAAGALILGLAGRAATAGVAGITGHATNLSLRGGLEAVGVGAIVGAAGGLVLLALAALGARPGPRRGIAVGGVLFAASFALGWFREQVVTGGAGAVLVLTLVVVAAVYVVFGVALDAAVRRVDPPARTRRTG